MASHSVSQLHTQPGATGPSFTVPSTGSYWVDGEVVGPGSWQLINVASQAVITAGSGSVQLTAGTQVAFKAVNTTAATKQVSGRIIPNLGPGTER